jgi:cytochrome c oxidase cbb3-type subunit 3
VRPSRPRLLAVVLVALVGTSFASGWSIGHASGVERQTTEPAARPAPRRPEASRTVAEPPSPPSKPSRRAAPAQRGQKTFASACAFCHGADARGGAQGGSDLLQSTVVLEDEGQGAVLAKFLAVGRPEKGMPPFSLPRAQVADMAAYLHARVTAAARSTPPAATILVGNATAGAAYFKGAGRCATCHSVTGDLRGIGAKYEPMMLQGRMLVPRGTGGYPGGDKTTDAALRATITPASGAAVTGDVVYLSDFYISVHDTAGRRHTFIRRGPGNPAVALHDPLHGHLALLGTITDEQMHDLTAYLATLK